jgi:K+-sensing histidine kinase KdpD
MKGDLIVRKHAPVLVCVTGQHDCDRLIRVGKAIAEERHSPLHVVSVVPSDTKDCCAELEYLRQNAQNAGAEMTIFFHDEPAYVTAAFLKQIGAQQLVTGMAEAPINGFIEVIHQLMPRVPIAMVDKDETVYHICPSAQTAISPQPVWSR